jgi:hypothetical protein
MRNLMLVFVALILAAGVMSTKLWRELRGERELTAALRAQLDEAGKVQAALPSTPAPVPTPAVPAPPAVAAVPADKPAPAVRPPQPIDMAASLREFEAQQRELWKDPEYRKARFAQIRTSVARNNMGLAEELGLSQAEADKLLDLLAEQEMRMSSDISLLTTDQKDQAAIQETMRQQQESMRQRDESIAALLGPGKNAQWRQYQQNGPARSRITAMNNTLAQAGQALDAAQQKSLTGVLSAQLKNQSQEMSALLRGIDTRDPAGRARFGEVQRQRQEETNRRILADAQSILNEQQLAVLRAQFAQQEAMNRAMERVRERTEAAQAQGGQ